MVSDRHRDILRLVVEGFIERGQPVSSLYITRNHSVGLSSATVRSIFVELDDLGYVTSPHRSSGRVPTERGYRLYAENISAPIMIAEEEQRLVQSEYLKRDFKVDDILDATGRVLAMMTNYASVVLGPLPEKAVLKHIELIDMGEDEMLIILVTRSGAVLSRTVFLENRVPGDYLRQISRRLNEEFQGIDLGEMRERLLRSNYAEDRGMERYFPMIARTISDNFESVQGREQTVTHGLESLYNHLAAEARRPTDPSDVFESGLITEICRSTVEHDHVEVVIEGDRDDRLSGLSVVAGNYKMGEKRIGALGVVGPNRMDYLRVMGAVEYVRRLISNMMTRISN